MPKTTFPTVTDWSAGTLLDLVDDDGLLTPDDGHASGQWLSPVVEAADFDHWVRQWLYLNVPEGCCAYFYFKTSADPDDLGDWSWDVEAPGTWSGPHDAEDLFGVVNVNLRTTMLRESIVAGAYYRFVVVLEGE